MKLVMNLKSKDLLRHHFIVISFLIFRQALSKSLKNILMTETLEEKFGGYISPIMKCFSAKIYTDATSLLDFTAEIISEIHTSLLEDYPELNSPTLPSVCLSLEEMQKMEMKYADLTIKINKLQDQLTCLQLSEDFVTVESLKKEMEKLVEEKGDLTRQRLNSTTATPTKSQPSASQPNLSVILQSDLFNLCKTYFI